MPDVEKWARRVTEWKASGLTSPEYCKGKPFTAGGLRHWAYQLSRGRRRDKEMVRVARVVRVASFRQPSRDQHEISAGVEAVVVALGETRVVVRPGFDRGTLAAVLEVVRAVERGDG